ncbi:MAG: ABC transporter permease [Planctomycetota bacterium]|nr:ABC transporter permease [Planctomycetota bacterium]
MGLLDDVGRTMLDAVETSGRGAILLARAARHMVRPRGTFGRIMEQEFVCGVCSIPVVAITALFSGMVISGQVGLALRQFDALSTVGGVTGITMCRELGPVLTAVVVAGFVGGGMASAIATMKVNEEIDALEVMSIDPVRYLVVPRLAAMVVGVPLLTVFADAVGIWGGWMVGRYTLGIPDAEFLRSCREMLMVKDVWFGMFKGLVFSIIITMVACAQGFAAEGGPEGVGRATMKSVVYSSLLILIANYLVFSLVWRPFLDEGVRM